MRFYPTLLAVLAGFVSWAQSPISDLFELRWQTHVGKTTFRTGMVFQDGSLYIPSNGEKSGVPDDTLDGLFVLNPIDGTIQHHYRQDISSGQDCNGVALDGNRIYFGGDHGKFYCYEGEKLIWTTSLNHPTGNAGLQESDPEGVPVLADLNGDNQKDVILNVESVGLCALDGKTGDLLWKFARLHYSGSYMNSPAVTDLNNDGIPDFIIGGKREPGKARYDYYDQNSVYAISGKTGNPIWEYGTHSNIHGSPIVLESDGDKRILVAESYSDVTVLLPDGRFDKFINLNMVDGGISGLFASPVITDKNKLIIGTSWWGSEDGVWVCDVSPENFKQASDGLIELDPNKRRYYQTGRVSATAVVADVYKKSKGNETLVCTESGTMLLFNADGNLIRTLVLPAGVEATPLVADIDGDKKFEIVISCLNGNTYCYGTQVKHRKTSQLFWPSFRGPNENGVVKHNGF